MKSRPGSVFLWGAFFLAGTGLTHAAQNPTTILVLGSSTAAGSGASTYSNSWVGLLTNVLAPKGFVVKNNSIGGTATGDSLARFDRDVTPYGPAFVILATSFANEPGTDTPHDYLQNTLLLIRKVESIGAIPIVVAPYPNDSFNASTYSSVKDIYASLNAEGVPILDFLDATDNGQGHWVVGMSLDGTHPTDVGHRLLFDCIPLTMFDSLQRPRPPMDPHGFGSWIQTTNTSARGDLEIQPYSGMQSWTVSYWTNPSAAANERTLLNLNNGGFQLRRTGSVWKLWNGSAQLATVDIREAPAFHHVALAYQSLTGTLSLYVDAQLRAQAVSPAEKPLTVLSIGGDPANAGLSAEGDAFADVLLYRAPLAQTDIQAIRIGHTPWKSVEAWLPLTYSPNRGVQNLAASVPTVIVFGTWTWSSQGISTGTQRPAMVTATSSR